MTDTAANDPHPRHFWHPMLHPNEMSLRKPIRIVRGDGCFVYDDAGKRLVDGVAGLWNVNVGHNRAEVKAAIVAQLDELEYFQLFDGVSHPRAEELSTVLIEMMAQEGMRRVMYSSGGSDAVETALKIARQYWKLEGQADRFKFIALKQGYHGSGGTGSHLRHAVGTRDRVSKPGHGRGIHCGTCAGSGWRDRPSRQLLAIDPQSLRQVWGVADR